MIKKRLPLSRLGWVCTRWESGVSYLSQWELWGKYPIPGLAHCRYLVLYALALILVPHIDCVYLAVYLSGLLPRLADGVCIDAVKYVSKEELGSAIIINSCDQFGNICSKEEQIICTAQWRRIDGSSNSEWTSACIDPNNRTHYQVLDS